MDNTWILKRTDGAHGDDIMLMDSKADILDFLDAQEDPKTPAWLVQKYVERPLLLEGSRKFDMRMWVLLDSQFNIRVFREGVLRTCSVPFTLDDLSNNYAHISNHGLQEKHADFGSKEEGNELMFSAFAKFLKTKGAALEDVIEQANEIICTTLLAVKDKEENQVDFMTFQVYGFDFMIDADINVSLLEVNASPAVADRLLKKFSIAVIESAIDPVFSGDAAKTSAVAGEESKLAEAAELPGSDDFDVIYVNNGKDGRGGEDEDAGKAEEVDFEFELIGAAKKMADDGGAAAGGKMEKK